MRVVYEKKIDVTAECERLKKELEKIDNGIASGQRQLGNKQFLAKAPPSVVENLRKQQQELAILREKTTGKLVQLGVRELSETSTTLWRAKAPAPHKTRNGLE